MFSICSQARIVWNCRRRHKAGESMNAVTPTRIVERLSLLNHRSSSSLVHHAPALGFAHLVQRRWRLAGCCTKKTAWSLKERNLDTEINEFRLVRPATEAHSLEAIEAVKTGKVIAVPTDTLYGFACDACSVEAVNRIYEIKGRNQTKPLAICVGDVTDIQRFAMTDHLPPGLLDSLLPGPVTVVLSRGELSILVKSLNPGFDSVGVRVPDCSFIRSVARGTRSALALTSANLSGEPSSVCIKDFENLWEHCAYVYDGGVLPSGRAGSTVVELTKPGKYKIVRAGREKDGIDRQYIRCLLTGAQISHQAFDKATISAQEETVAILEGHTLIEERGDE